MTEAFPAHSHCFAIGFRISVVIIWRELEPLFRPLHFFPTEEPFVKVSQGAKIRNRCNQVPHITQDTNGKVTNSQLDTTNESQEVSPFPAGDHKAHINRRTKAKQTQHRKKHKISTTEVPPWNGHLNILLEGLNRFNGANLTLNSDMDQDT